MILPRAFAHFSFIIYHEPRRFDACLIRFTDNTPDLEQAAAPATGTTTLAIPISGVGSRHASEGEIKYLQPLVKKYGDNVHLMARDLRLNPEQRTAGQLKRALMKSQIVI